jgi:Helix-turn-helix domain
MSNHADDAIVRILRRFPKYGSATVTPAGTDSASVAKLVASPARPAVVDALTEGRPLTASELARTAGVRASTVSEHLDGGVVAVRASYATRPASI